MNCPARLTAAIPAENANGQPYLALVFMILDGPLRGQELRYYGGLEAEAKSAGGKPPRQMTLDVLRACGWDGQEARRGGLLTGELDDLLTAGHLQEIVDVVVEDDDRGRPRIRYVNATGGRSVRTPLSPEKARALGVALQLPTRRTPLQPRPIASYAPPFSAAPAATDDHPNAPGRNDDIPF